MGGGGGEYWAGGYSNDESVLISDFQMLAGMHIYKILIKIRFL